ncbi:MAG: alpha/beta fold hydrolase, partial [Prevotella sp.]|nr:alpha/beta fold hydrolase [Prevotella sp.]
MKTFHYPHPFKLESGEILPDITIAYHTYGKINGDGSNVVWVCHALTANSDVREWWPNTVAEGRFLDPNRFFIVCANILGSCYGTTGPLSVNPLTDKPWYGTFPHISVRDVVTAHQLLAAHLGIKKIHTLIGSSVGGFQCVEWCVTHPAFIERAVIIASDSR